MFRQNVEREYDRFIKEKFKPLPQIVDFLIRHTNRDRSIDAICDQILIYERGRRRHDLTYWKKIVEAGARSFCDAALRHQEEKLLSAAERMRRMDEAKKNDPEAQLVDHGFILEDRPIEVTTLSQPDDVDRLEVKDG